MRGRDVVRQRFQRLNSFRVGFPGLKQPWDSQKKLEWNAEALTMRGRDVVRHRFQRLNSFRVGFPGLRQPWDSQKKLEWNAESVDYEGARRRSPTLSAFELFSCWLPRVEATLGWNSPTPLAFCFREKAFCFPQRRFASAKRRFVSPQRRFASAKRRFVSPQRRFASAKIGRAKTYLLSPGEQLLSRGE